MYKLLIFIKLIKIVQISMQKDWQHSLITKQYTLKITDVTTRNETSMLLLF
jgi:hypothetical protein